MTKSLQKSNTEKQVVQKKEITLESTKAYLDLMTRIPCDPKVILKELNELFNQFANCSKKDIHKINEKINDKLSSALSIYNLDNHISIAETTDEKYRPLLMEFCNQLTKEYNCQAPSEKALVQIVASAYIRVIEYSRKMEGCTSIDFISNEKNGYYSMLSKEIDRAQRHFISSLTTLKQLKAPKFDINVKVKNAFVSQNQQINNNLKPDENIKPK